VPASGPDYYRVLGVDRSAGEKDIKQAFRRLARKYHPDVNPGDKDAERKFKEISEAYAVLSNPDKRKQFDQFGTMGDVFGQGGAGPFGGHTWYASSEPGFQGFDDLLSDLLGGRRAAPPRPRRGQDIRADIALTLADAYHGITRQISLSAPQFCPQCQGAGTVGRGASCPECKGHGQFEKTKRLEVKIPAGVRDGAKIRLAGQGVPSPSGRPGDLLLTAHITPHRFFTRRGDDLYADIEVAFPQAALGAEIEAPTLDGKVKTTLPPGTSSGRRLRLAGKGMPKPRGGGRGDLYLTVKITVPKDLTAEEKDLIQRLAAARPEAPKAQPE
jgi:DnaJ-class molecular chaperone